MFTDKLKSFYVSFLYKFSALEMSALNKLMLHAINVQGLDPTRDVEKIKKEQLQREFDSAFAPGSRPIGMRHPVSKNAAIFVRKPFPMGEETQAYINKVVVPPGSVPDYSDAGKSCTENVAYVTADKLKEITDKLIEKYTPAYEAVPPPGTPAVNEDLTLSSEEADAILQDKKIFEIINKPKKKKVTKKPVKSVKKTTKKPAKKSRKK